MCSIPQSFIYYLLANYKLKACRAIKVTPFVKPSAGTSFMKDMLPLAGQHHHSISIFNISIAHLAFSLHLEIIRGCEMIRRELKHWHFLFERSLPSQVFVFFPRVVMRSKGMREEQVHGSWNG